MAHCHDCGQDMREGVSCAPFAVRYPDGGTLPPLAFGRNADDGGTYGDTHGAASHCPDCLTPRGGWHHPGCAAEQCPRCGGQLIGCACLALPAGGRARRAARVALA
jgi:hypothetical protein